MHCAFSWLLTGAALASGAVAQTPTPYIDAHSHLVTVMTPFEEISRMRRAGLRAAIVMDPDPAALAEIRRRDADFVIPFGSIARTATMVGTHPDADAAAALAALLASGSICGFGEIPTRLDPNPDPSDDISLFKPWRTKIYALANAHAVPVNIHVSLDTPATIAAVDKIAADYPHMKLILAHAGWMAGPDVIGKLLAARPNLWTDLSVRLDRPGAPGVDARNVNGIVDAEGRLKPEWRALIERFPDRFLFGLDVTLTQRPQHIAELVADARRALAPLGPPIEEAVAHGNIERLVQGCPATPWLPAPVRQAPPDPTGFSGTIVSTGEEQIELTLRDGSRKIVPMSRGWTIGTARATTADRINPGDFVASIQAELTPAAGKANEVRIFEPGYRPEIGTHAMPQPNSAITHGTVAANRPLSGGGRQLLVTYPGGSRTIIVPPGTRITVYDLRDRAMAKPGASVSAIARTDPDGMLRAGRLLLVQ